MARSSGHFQSDKKAMFMKPIHFAALVWGAWLSSSIASAASGPNPTMPMGNELTATVTALDATLFGAYNRCDLATFARYTAPDVEFYHDKGGLTLGREKLVESVKNNICGKVRRELVPGSLEIFPIKDFGAVEMGTHRFCELSTGRCDGIARFVQLWQYRDGNWLLTRVISYDHHLAATSSKAP